jgi:type I restriction enzyme S subunit
MVVKEGYKQTEIGEIPNDWEVKNLLDNFTIKARIGWQGLTTAEYLKTGDYGLVTGTDFKNGYIDWDNCVYVERERFVQDKNIQLKIYDVLVTKDGTIGKVAFVDKLPNPTTLNSGVFVLRPKNENINNRFFYSILMSFYFDSFLAKITAGSTITHLYQKDFVNFNFILPTLAEQTAIASALSDADGLISGLEKLIAKKRNIKQGAMQQLLQPKEGWEVKKLGEVGKCLRGVSYNPERDLHSHDKNITSRLLRSNNVKNRNLDFNNLQFVNIDKVKTHQFLQKGDIVICMANGSKQLVGKSAIFNIKDNIKYTFGAFMGCFRTDEKIASSSFIAVNFQTFQYRCYIDVLLSGSSINNLNPSNIESIEIPFPPIAEQTRIASILSDMDAEILALEQKLEKYKKVKLGMMQELLTGKTRLV